jgi:hypothetical protein
MQRTVCKACCSCLEAIITVAGWCRGRAAFERSENVAVSEQRGPGSRRSEAVGGKMAAEPQRLTE